MCTFIFLLPYRIVQALTQGSIRKKNYVDKIFKIFDSWDVSVASVNGTNRHEHTNSVTQVFCLLQLLLQQGVIFAQENLISSSTWKSMSIVDALCNMIFLLTAKLKDIEDRDTGKFGNSSLDALTNIIIDLLQDHCTVYSSDIPKLVKSMLPHVNENHISSKVLPLLGRVLSGENFMVKSGGKRSGKTMVDVAAVSQTVRQFDLKNLKKVNNFLKEFTLRNTPVDEFSQFMGTVSLCKFVATHTSSLNGAPDLLLQSGILQNFITLGLGLRKTNFLKRSKEKTSAKSIDTNIFSSPSWIISHNFILWYALNNHSFAIYMSKVNDFVDFVRDATYQSQKPIDALFWEVVFHFGTFVNNEKEGKKPTKCKFEPDCAIKTMEKIYPLEKNMEFETANSLYCFLERTITSKLLSSATGGCQANMPPFVAAFRSYCMRCQRMITRGEMDIFVLQAPKATSNENSKEEILSQKDVSKKRTLKTKYSKLFKKFLDQKDA